MMKLPPRLPAVVLCFCLVAVVSRADTDEILDGPLEGLGATDEVFSLPGLTGDWGGRRTWLSEHGLEFSADLTNTLQGVMDGGFDETARYLGSSELILDVDAEKLGLWPGGFARVAAEGRFGKDVVVKAGSFSPVNNDAIFPADPDQEGDSLFAITELNATQFLAPWIGIFGGLLNTTSGDANDFAGFLRSNEHFQNASMLASLVALQLVPNVTLGGGIVVIPFEGLAGTRDRGIRGIQSLHHRRRLDLRDRMGLGSRRAGSAGPARSCVRTWLRSGFLPIGRSPARVPARRPSCPQLLVERRVLGDLVHRAAGLLDRR
jgi:hypothetical protein